MDRPVVAATFALARTAGFGDVIAEWLARAQERPWSRPVGRYGPAAASLAVNVLLVSFGLSTVFHSAELAPNPIALTLVTSPVTPPSPVAAPKSAPPRAATPRPQAPATRSAPTSDPLTLPSAAPASEPGVETVPAIPGVASPAVPKGLLPYLNVDPCADAAARKRNPKCGSIWAERRDAIPERQWREERAMRVKEMARELGVYNDCGSVHLGCAPAPDRTLAGAAIARGTTGSRSPMSAGGPSGISAAPMQHRNSYHVDPGFGD